MCCLLFRMLGTGTSVVMQKGPANNMYMPTIAQQQAGFAQQAVLNHGYHTRSAAAQLAPGVGGTRGVGAVAGNPGMAAQGYRGGSAPQQSSSRPW
jgi:hypothetical protein